jgi:hypothetical protein
LNVEHLLTKPQSPQTIGKIEGWHRNVQRELLGQKQLETVSEAQKAIEEYLCDGCRGRLQPVHPKLERHSLPHEPLRGGHRPDGKACRVCQVIYRCLATKGLDTAQIPLLPSIHVEGTSALLVGSKTKRVIFSLVQIHTHHL